MSSLGSSIAVVKGFGIVAGTTFEVGKDSIASLFLQVLQTIFEVTVIVHACNPFPEAARKAQTLSIKGEIERCPIPMMYGSMHVA